MQPAKQKKKSKPLTTVVRNDKAVAVLDEEFRPKKTPGKANRVDFLGLKFYVVKKNPVGQIEKFYCCYSMISWLLLCIGPDKETIQKRIENEYTKNTIYDY